MKAYFLTLFMAFILSNSLFAQNRDYSMIYIYRTNGLAINYEYPIIFNNVIIHKMPVKNKFSYKIYSEGKLHIELAGNVKIDLDIEHGKNYYIRCPNNGVSKIVSEKEGKKEFDNQNERPDLYTQMEEDLNYPIIRKNTTNEKYTANKTDQVEKKAHIESDIDINIPKSNAKNDNKYALIIGNEDYSSYQPGLENESNVDFAIDDARIIKEYARLTFGIPDENIIYLENAKAIEMSRSIKTLNTIIKNSNNKAEIFVYYAGHGFPSETTNEAYIIPVDVGGTDLQFAVKLNDLYDQLTEFPSRKVTIVLDACFSGGGRNQSLLAARGVKIKPKENVLKGNLVVFTASTGEQSSLSYKDKGHGLFTYYLLKKIQETSGDITYKELSDYLSEQVGIKSALINQKEQNPQTLVSIIIKDEWENWKIK